MKRFISIPLLALAAACGGSNDNPSGLTVAVEFNGIQDQSVQLVESTDSGLHVIDSSFVTGGLVNFHSDAFDYPKAVFVKYQDIRRPIFLFLHKGDMHVAVSGDASQFSYTVSGDEASTTFNQYMEAKDAYNNMMSSLNSEYQTAMSIGDSLTLIHLQDKADELVNGNRRKMIDLAKTAGVFGAHIANNELYDADFMLLDSVYTNVPAMYSKSPVVSTLKDRIDALKRVAIGEPYVDIAQLDTVGNPIRLSDHLTRYTLIDFWASWCGPCRAENPNVVAAFEKYKDRGFSVVGVSLDESRQDWVKAINDDKLFWTQMSDLQGWRNGGAADYAVRAIPQNVMIDENGIIVAKNLREAELHEWLESNL